MTERRRAKFFSIMASNFSQQMTVHLWQLNNMVRCDDILNWLIANGLKGERFLFFVFEHGGMLKAAAEITRRLEKSKKRRPLYAGRDFFE